jgi:hypothetical protein
MPVMKTDVMKAKTGETPTRYKLIYTTKPGKQLAVRENGDAGKPIGHNPGGVWLDSAMAGHRLRGNDGMQLHGGEGARGWRSGGAAATARFV